MRRIVRAALCGVSAIAFGAAAQAQETSPARQAEQVPQGSSGQPTQSAPDTGRVSAVAVGDAQTGTEATGASDVVVTGSRIVQNGFQAPTPLSVLSSESIERTAAVSVPEALRELPALNKSTSSRQTSTNSSADPNSNSGTYLNLRNLGNQRLLLLQDGMRVPPNRPDGQTDANLIPDLLVSRVEVVTGGASAAYGSDAVAGVINYILDNRFTGVKGVAQGGISGHGDAGVYRFGAAAGATLGENIHIVASAEYRQDDGISSSCARPLGCSAYQLGGVNGATGAGTAANPYTTYANVAYNAVTADGYIKTVFNANGSANAAANAQLAGRNLVFQPGGAVLQPYTAGTVIGGGTCINCSATPLNADQLTLVPPSRSFQGYLHGEVDLSPAVTYWVQGSYVRTHVTENLLPEYFFGTAGTTLTIYSGNAYLSQAVQNVLTQTGADRFQLDTIRDAGRGDLLNLTYDGVTQSRNISMGFRGRLGGDWRWRVNGFDALSSLRQSGYQSENAKLYAALDAVRDPSGNIVCRVALTNPGILPGCVPLNLFGVGSPSQAAKDYIRGRYVATQTTTMSGASADVSGHPFSTWAGPVGIAVGVEYRDLGLEVTSNANDRLADTGVRYGTGSTLRYRANNIQPTRGSYSVKEAFGEINVPLLRDVTAGGLSIAREVNLNGAVRYTDYSISGGVTSWKGGLSWTVSSDIRLRGTRSRDIRAPTLNDFFQPSTTTFTQFTDPRTNNTTGVVPTVIQGNLNLKPERADTTTAGVVLSPSFLPGFTVSVDWYRISIDDAIQTFTGAALVSACEASNGTSNLCDGVIRPGPFSDRSPANYPTRFLVQPFNAVKLIVSGVDFEAGYRVDIGRSRLDYRLLGTYQYDYRTQTSPQNPLVQAAGYTLPVPIGVNPKLSLTQNINFSIDNFSINQQTRRVGSWNRNTPPGYTGTAAIFAEPNVKPVYYFDIGFAYNFQVAGSKRMQAFVNVDNVFDRSPPLLPVVGNPGLVYPTQRGLYDVIGRFFTAGIRFQY